MSGVDIVKIGRIKFTFLSVSWPWLSTSEHRIISSFVFPEILDWLRAAKTNWSASSVLSVLTPVQEPQTYLLTPPLQVRGVLVTQSQSALCSINIMMRHDHPMDVLTNWMQTGHWIVPVPWEGPEEVEGRVRWLMPYDGVCWLTRRDTE